jgi:HEAT repeat protein
MKDIGVDAQLALPVLVEALKDPDAGVRLGAVYVLGRMRKHASAAAASIRELFLDEDELVRTFARTALLGLPCSTRSR